MDHKCCEYCGKNFNINKFYKNLDENDNSDSNIIYVCEDCKHQYLLKVARNATNVCLKLGLKVNNKGEWIFDKETVRKELTNVRILEDENKILKEDIVMLQDKLHNLVYKFGYDRAINLKENQRLLDWDQKKNYHCWKCGTIINWHKRDGRYIFTCKCGATYITEIERIIVTKL
jgi:ribosomal protein L37AE/L43A